MAVLSGTQLTDCVSDLLPDVGLFQAGCVCSEFISSVVSCLRGVLLKCAL